MSETFTPDEWEVITERWRYIQGICREIAKAVDDHNQGQLWASAKSVAEKLEDLAEGVVGRILRRAKEELHMPNDDARIIVHLLIGRSEKYQYLYTHSAYMKTALDAVIRDFLPAMIAGFAALAEEKDAQLRHAIESQRLLAMTPVSIEDIQKFLRDAGMPEMPDEPG